MSTLQKPTNQRIRYINKIIKLISILGQSHRQQIPHPRIIHSTTNKTKQRDFQVHKVALQKRHPPFLAPFPILKPTITNTPFRLHSIHQAARQLSADLIHIVVIHFYHSQTDSSHYAFLAHSWGRIRYGSMSNPENPELSSFSHWSRTTHDWPRPLNCIFLYL